MGLILGIVVMMAILAWAPGETGAQTRCPSRPSDIALAKKLATQWYQIGIGLFKARRFKQAYEAFRCTSSILEARLTHYWIARSAQAAGLLEEALEEYEALLKAPPALVTHQELRQRLNEVKRKLDARKARTRPARPRDGGSPGPAADGSGTRPGFVPTTKHTRSGPRPLQIAAWSSWGGGGALLIAGIALAAVTAQNRDKISKANVGTWWEPDLKARYDRHDSLVAGTWTCLALGMAAVAAGTILFFVDRAAVRERSSAGPSAGPGAGTGTLQLAPLQRGAFVGYSLRY